MKQRSVASGGRLEPLRTLPISIRYTEPFKSEDVADDMNPSTAIFISPKSMYMNHVLYFLYSDTLTSWGLADPGGTVPSQSQLIHRDSKKIPFIDKPINPKVIFWSSPFQGSYTLCLNCSRSGTRLLGKAPVTQHLLKLFKLTNPNTAYSF